MTNRNLGIEGVALQATGTPIRLGTWTIPIHGESVEVAKGVHWCRQPVLDESGHVNVYLLEDNDGLTLVDTGSKTRLGTEAIKKILSHPKWQGRALKQVIVTHFHHDHIGLAGSLVQGEVHFLTTEVCWLTARMLYLDQRSDICSEELLMMERAGVRGMELEAFRRVPPAGYAQGVSPIPGIYSPIREGDFLPIGDRLWTVRIGHGHASHHATLWSDDGILLSGDQLLLGTSSNLSVPPFTPDADLVELWKKSCDEIRNLSDDEMLCLPGHNVPFYGVATRCSQLLESMEMVLTRLLDSLQRPRTAYDCCEVVYRRKIGGKEMRTLLSETIGFLNHLDRRGLVQREWVNRKFFVWRRKSR
jgi:glyoxylase-like metal-dependent hydrolase (beta-lactamase superfamily II)